MYTASEKLAIIGLVEDSELSIRRTLVEINVSRSSFYRCGNIPRVQVKRNYSPNSNLGSAISQHFYTSNEIFICHKKRIPH
jgi:hypothetical protein